MGASTARALAQAGRRVILLEQHALGHDRGSSHGASRIFRFSYPDPNYVRLAQGARQAWRELEAECDEELIVETGDLTFGALAGETARALASCGVRHELLTGAQVSARWPIGVHPDEEVLFQQDGGTTRSDLAYKALLGSATANGAVALEQQRVVALERRNGSVHITTESDTFIARACVVAAGAWSRPLLATLDIELPVIPTRETITYFRIPDPLGLPPIIDDAVPDAEKHGLRRPGLINYALAAPGIGLKAGLHHAGPVTDPDQPGVPDPAIVRWVSTWAAARYPELDPEPVGTETCIYTSTADESFVLERHGRVVVASACSGHGFKFAPSFGRTVAALAGDAAG